MKTGIQTHFLEYSGLIKAMKHYLQIINIKITHNEPTPFVPTNILSVLENRKGSKDMYKILYKTNDIPTGQATWNKIYNIANDPFSITSYPALQWFQISINHNTLVTNKLLYQMKIQEDALCTFCQTTNESIIHLFSSPEPKAHR